MLGMATGDARALGEVYDRLAPALYGIARAHRPGEAEDLAHAVFRSLWRSAPRFRRDGLSAERWVVLTIDHAFASFGSASPDERVDADRSVRPSEVQRARPSEPGAGR